MKEAVIDDHDVVKGLLDFANRNSIHSIVIGASNKNHLTRFLSILCEVVLLFYMHCCYYLCN